MTGRAVNNILSKTWYMEMFL